MQDNQLATSKILDVHNYQFPVFDERVRLEKEPLPPLLASAEKIKAADGIIIVTPEYNGGCAASLKNVTDVLYDECNRKRIAICTVSDGMFGDTQVITSLQFSLIKIGAWTVPAMFPVSKADLSFGEQGKPIDKKATDKRVHAFMKELIWFMEAKAKMDIQE